MIRVIALLLVTLPWSTLAAEPIKIGNDIQLFGDSSLIESHVNFHRKYHTPTPKEVSLTTDKPWEGNVSAYFTFLQDGDQYRAYYRGSHYDTTRKIVTHREVTCVATSKDGIHWEKPELGIWEFAGSKKNNIVWDGIGVHCFAPFVDENPACPVTERYKAVSRGLYVKGDFTVPERQKGVRGLYVFSSPDGLNWKLLSESPVITDGAFDSQNIAFWDTNKKKYVCYSRLFINGVRSIQYCESKDFMTWTKPTPISYAKDYHEHLYTNAIQQYPSNPKLYVGLPTRYLPDENSRVEPIFMHSHDGRHFFRNNEPFIPESFPEDRSGNRSNYACRGILSLPHSDTTFSIYATEAYYTGSDSRVRRFEIRKDGFVSLHSTGQSQIVTKPILIEGDAIFLNNQTRGKGGIGVDLYDEKNQPIPGFSKYEADSLGGDAISNEVLWKQGRTLKELRGKAVKIHITYSNSDIYSLQIK
ncbi:MAG: hypothetical protein CMJ79_14640 [Planctomycetaceae bacterium]|nr:hypothetical protein [Planctomycetaceae bacterium]|tara:strand:- start:4295 stop:5707 length:1413 start_codon:yes stop_codon:yes gene_type:complete